MAIDPGDVRRCGLGWAAKVLASGVFLTGREPREIVRHSCGWMVATDEEIRAVIQGRARLELERRLEIEIDGDRRAVTLTLDGCHRGTAREFGSQGCCIVADPTARPAFTPVRVKPDVPDPDRTPWPMGDLTGDRGSTGVDPARVDAALDVYFENPRQHTNAVVVVHRGEIVGERYRPPFDRSSRFESWSMGKSVAATLVGRLIQQGELDLDAPPSFEEWAAPGDPRRRIRLRDLLRMSSGIRFTGSQGQEEDPTQKAPGGRFLDHLYVYAGAVDAYRFCSGKEAEFPPNTVGRYRNCDPLLAMRAVRDRVGVQGGEFLEWPQRVLFDRLGIRGIVLETDPFGNFLVTGHDYGRARDWSRLGLLWLQRGVWCGERLLPERYVDFVREPAPAWPEPSYGGLFWLNRSNALPTLPPDAFWMAGAGGQRTIVVPSLDLVIVRMGHLSGELAGRAATMDRANGLLAEAVQYASHRSGGGS